jgi:spermidine/putrescine transport system substrate-binding protein
MPPRNPRYSRLNDGRSPFVYPFTRRRFLALSSAALSGAVLANCTPNISDPAGQTDPAGTTKGDDKTLHIFGWANYVDQAVMDSFQAKTGIKVISDIFDSNEAMLAKLQAGGGAAYSVIYPSDYMVTQMIEMELLTALDQSRLQSGDNLKEQWKNPVYDPANAHSLPISWGTTGLIYNPENWSPDPKGWADVWEKRQSLSRKVTLINDAREVMGATLLYLGYDFNSEDAKEIEEAYEKLVELKPAIANFMTNGWEEQLSSGDLLLSMAFSVDAITLIEENPALKYFVPETGASLWTDTMVIPKTAPNVDGAYEWINFVSEPENASQMVTRLRFSTPIQAAFDLLPTELKEDERMFPPDDILAKCRGVAPVSQATAELYDEYWTKLTSA